MNHLAVGISSEDHAQGPSSAPVTLVEYGDYECPYCAESYRLVKAVQELMGDRLCFVFRNFPLYEVHPHAVRAAEFAEAASAIGRFWPAHDLLYQHQAALTDSDLLLYGARLGLDHSAIADAFNGRYDRKIRGDFIGGVRSGVNGTPTLFINGSRYDGPRDIDRLIEALSQAALRPQLHAVSR